MNDWGITKGLTGLYADVGKRESATREIGVLNMLDQQMQKDQQQKEIDQMKQQAYYAEVSKFADTLLAPDRERINRKAKLLGKQIQENVSLYNGDMGKFLANGGHRIMSEYKNNLINSEESTTYLQNKKNAEMIIDLQKQGKGHLINPTDLANFENYNKNGGGQITYTGMLNEIEMPDDQNYDYGTLIPSKDILYHPNNYMKIYGNYVTTYPNEGEPSESDLLRFVDANYQQKGANWQRVAAIQRTKNERIKAMSKTSTKTEDEGVFGKNYTNQYTGQVQRLFSYLPGEGSTIKDFKEGYWNNFEYKEQLNNISSGESVDYATNYSLKHDSLFDFNRNSDIPIFGALKGTLLEDWFEEEYAPRNAKRIYNERESEFAKAFFGEDLKIDMPNKIINEIQPNENWMDPMGNRLGDLKDELDYKEYKGSYKIEGIITGATIKSNNEGNEMTNMVMNVIDNGKISEEKTNILDNAYGESELKHQAFMVLENEDKVRFYVPVDLNETGVATKISNGMGELDNLKPMVQDSFNRKSEEAYVEQMTAQQEAAVNNFWNEIDGNEQYSSSIYSESLVFSKDNQYDAVRDPLIKSFYGAMTQLSMPQGNLEEASTRQNIQNIFNSGNFTKWMQEASGEQGIDYAKQIKDYSNSDVNIIETMIKNDPDNAQFYQAWLQNYNYLAKR